MKYLKQNKLQFHVDDDMYNIIISIAAMRNETVAATISAMIDAALPNALGTALDARNIINK